MDNQATPGLEASPTAAPVTQSRSGKGRYLAVALVALILGAGLTWLVMRQPSPQPSTDQASTSATTSITVATVTPSPTPTPTPNLTSQCHATSLQASISPADGAAGSSYYKLSLTNTSNQSCSLTGFAGVSLVTTKGEQVGQPAERTTDTPAAVSLSAGKTASATLRVVHNNFEAGVCQDGSSQLKIYPPDQKDALTIATTITTWCPGMTISPFKS